MAAGDQNGWVDDGATLIGLLAEEDRLRVVSAVVLGAATSGEIADATGLDGRHVRRALERLVAGGLVEVAVAAGGGERLRVAVERFGKAARHAAACRTLDVRPEDLGATVEQAAVLRHFMADGRLTGIPAVRRRRLVVLDFLAGRFEPGETYPEKEVNGVLGAFHDDYATLRRQLVDEGFLERRDGFYWRAGGTFEVD